MQSQVCARCSWTIHRELNIDGKKLLNKLEIRSAERGICPTATLYSSAAAYKRSRCKQGAIIFHGGRVIVNVVHGNRGQQKKNLNKSIGKF